MSAETIPIVIGVTAHRAIREQDRRAIREAVRAELIKIRQRCPASPLLMLNSLAEGGDLLCADVAEELEIPLMAALPRAQEDYEKDFSPEALKRFHAHCARAESVFVVPPAEHTLDTDTIRDSQFRQAGIYVVLHSHVVLALWDGGPGAKAACGTAEAVSFALKGTGFPDASVSPLRGGNKAVIHVVTPRGTMTSESAGSVHLLGDQEKLFDVLQKTEDYNRSACGLNLDQRSRLPENPENDPVLSHIELVGRASGKLSLRSAKRYRRVLAFLAAAGALLTFAFLMYDEAEATWMILICGVMLAFAWGCQRYASRSDCHRRYIEYRVLAECMRVQTYLRYAGSRINAAELLSWTQQEETSWVQAALYALTIGNPPESEHAIRACWVDEQRDYHKDAAGRSARDLHVSERTVYAALLLSIALYLGAVIFELLCGGLVLKPSIQVSDVELYRTVLKIVLGTISVVTLFVANYYGKLSLSRTLSDHRKMERFYSKMSSLIETFGQTEELLTTLAREELIENGNWCSYLRDNSPDFSL